MLLCFIKVHLCSPNEEFLGARMIPMVPVFNGLGFCLRDSYEGPCGLGTPAWPLRISG